MPAREAQALTILAPHHSAVDRIHRRFLNNDIKVAQVLDYLGHSRWGAGREGGEGVACSISLDALTRVAESPVTDDGMEVFRRHRSRIEQAARVKYLERPVAMVGEVHLTRDDLKFAALRS